jgi:predicted transposase/invertase (TIGR01784 family)
MKHHIDPRIDCVFKALLGSEGNLNLLLNFLNAVLSQELNEPIIWVQILNPFNEKEFIDDKLSVVDVKAKDSQDRLYQVEIQMQRYSNLPARVIYNWADIYSQQLISGNDYHNLKATYSIWLMAEDVVKGDEQYLHEYKLRDDSGRILTEHGGIFILELNKFNDCKIKDDKQIWLKFFKDGESFDDDNSLPDWMNTNEMRQAMSTLKQFSEKEQNYHLYQARQNFLREQRTIQWEFEQNLEQERQLKLAAMQRERAAMQDKDAALLDKVAAMREKDAAMREKEAAIQREEASMQRETVAQQEIAHLKALLGKP